MTTINSIINANGLDIRISSINEDDYISLTDIAKYRSDEPAAVIQNWLRNRNTLEYLGLWEQMNNTNFKPLEFEEFRSQAGLFIAAKMDESNERYRHNIKIGTIRRDICA